MKQGQEKGYSLYNHKSLGSVATADNAIPRAEPKAFWTKKMDMTKDFILGGALVKAYSSPVMLAKISERAMKK